MTQMVFIHGPGAGGCAESFVYQLEHYLGSLAPTLPGHPEGAACTSVERYAEWLRGWLWSQGKRKELVLVGYTLGGCIALQYALDYPDEVKALVLMTTACARASARRGRWSCARKPRRIPSPTGNGWSSCGINFRLWSRSWPNVSSNVTVGWVHCRSIVILSRSISSMSGTAFILSSRRCF